MAKEILAIGEDYLQEFIKILETGMVEHEASGFEISERLKYSLINWIKEEKEYIKRISGGTFMAETGGLKCDDCGIHKSELFHTDKGIFCRSCLINNSKGRE